MRPTLVLNPRSDAAFTSRVRAAAKDSLERPDDLAQHLRQWYPHVVVRPRELSAERATVWYVYRDGRWTSEGSRSGG